MSVADDVELHGCVNHPARQTALRCNKCGDPICTACVIQTPVGGRCRRCAQLRRLPQYEIDPWLLLRSAAAGAAVSLVGWYVLSYVASLRYFLAFLVGVGVGEVMSALSRRRTNRALEITGVVVVVGGLVLVEMLRRADGSGLLGDLASNTGLLVYLVVPAVIASTFVVVKLR